MPNIFYFLPESSESLASIDSGSKISSKISSKITRVYSLKELSSIITARPDYIGFHCDFLKNSSPSEFMLMINTLISSIDPTQKPKIGFVFEKNTNLTVIKSLRRHNIDFFIPGAQSYGTEVTINASLATFENSGNYFPKHLIDTLPGNIKPKKNTPANILTSRQKEVFDLIAKRGLTNKQVARVLSISESTVKIHVSSIFKLLCVRNRTQLALTKI